MTVENVVTLIQRVKNSWIIEEPGFDPGDRLIAVNGTNVEDMDRDSVLRLLKEGVGGRMLQVRESLKGSIVQLWKMNIIPLA